MIKRDENTKSRKDKFRAFKISCFRDKKIAPNKFERRQIKNYQLFSAAALILGALIILTMLLTVFPQIATYLPSRATYKPYIGV